MAKLYVLGNWHGGSNAVQYVRALRTLGHEVVTVGPRWGLREAGEWAKALKRMAWSDPAEVARYTREVYADRIEPDVFTAPGGWLKLWKRDGADAVIKFEAYGETPNLDLPDGVPAAVVYGDTHTGHLKEYVEQAPGYDHVFVQFRRKDAEHFRAAGHPSVHWLPAAADPDVWFHLPDCPKWHDVLFVGSTDPEVHRERVELLDRLRSAGVNVHIEHSYGRRAAFAMNHARIVLNRSLNGDLNMRIPEALCTGAALVADAVDGLEELANGYCFTYDYNPDEPSVEDLLERLLSEESVRRAAGEGGRAHVLAHHTYVHRARQLLRVLGLKEGETHAGTDRGRSAGAGSPDRDQAVLRPPSESAAPDPLDPGAGAVHTGAESAGGGAVPAAPLVSIVIPQYGHWEDCTRPLLERLKRQYEVPEISFEPIVVDDGSPDKASRDGDAMVSWQLPHGFKMVRRNRNGGFAAACNDGARAARGTYLVFLNNDTEPEPGWLGPLVRELEAGAGIVGSHVLNEGGNTQSAGLYQSPSGEWWNQDCPDRLDSPHDVPAVTGACLAIRKDTFLRLGGFDEGFRNGCEDVDLCLRARARGLAVRFVPGSRVVHREGTTRFGAAAPAWSLEGNVARLQERWGGLHDVQDTGAMDAGGGGAQSAGAAAPDATGGAAAAQSLGADRSLPAAEHDHLSGGPETGPTVKEAGGETDGRGAGCPGGGGNTGSGADGGLLGGVRGAAEGAARGRPLSVVLDGPFDVQQGGSLAVVNTALKLALDRRNWLQMWTPRSAPAAPTLWVTHYWPGEAAHRRPPESVKHWCVIQPWELGAPPTLWNETYHHPKFRELWVPSEYSRQLYLRHTSLRRSQVRVLSNGVDTEVFTPEGPMFQHRYLAGPSSAALRVLFVGGLLWRKGIDLLQRTWTRAFPRPGEAQLLLKSTGGESFYRHSTHPLSTEFRERGDVMWLAEDGYTPHQMAEMHRWADVLVAPSRAEGFCLPVLEAMACGTPVAVPSAGPTNEYVDESCGLRLATRWLAEDRRGLYYEVDEEALAKCLRWCLDNRRALKELGVGARRRALDYSWEQIAGQYAEAIRKVCDER